MKSAVFVFLNGLVSIPRTGAVVLVSTPRHIPIAKGMLVSAGVTNASVVTMGQAHIRLFVDHPEAIPVKEGMTPVPMKFDAEVLSALIPGATIDVGSIKYAMPNHSWLTDQGAQIVRLPNVLEKFESSSSQNVEILHDLDTIQELPHGYGFGKRIKLWNNKVRDIPLVDGDTVVSKDGRWYFREGSLYTHKAMTMLSTDVRFTGGTTLGPRNPTSILIGRLSEQIDLTLIWPDDGSKHRYEGVLTKPGIDWKMTLNIRTPIVMDPAGTCFGNRQATAERCIKEGNIWDRPCSTDSECPYHDPRRGRGGCKSGMCEMPMKVSNASFRIAGTETSAMVHGCSPTDPKYPFCIQPSYQSLFSGEIIAQGVRPDL
jgi:hypothetical protein